MHLRINRAKHLLLGTALSIKQIAEVLNFESVYHFSAMFKKKTALSPSQWRGGRYQDLDGAQQAGVS